MIRRSEISQKVSKGSSVGRCKSRGKYLQASKDEKNNKISDKISNNDKISAPYHWVISSGLHEPAVELPAPPETKE